MIKFILRNNLYLMATLGIAVAVVVAVQWNSMPILQRMVGLFFVGLVMRLIVAQQIVIRGSGMKYSEFLKRVRTTVMEVGA